jgi:hypothetical protein
LASFTFPAHEVGAERALGRVLIMRAAAEPYARHRRLSSTSERLNMIKLEPGPRLAAPAVLAHKRALATVTLPHGATDRCGDMAAFRRTPLRSWPLGLREFLLFELANQ